MPDDIPDAALLDAVLEAHRALDRAGVRHAMIGGLAVAHHGYLRATKDADFLVGPEAFRHHEGGLVTLREGIPFRVGDFAIDLLEGSDEMLDTAERESHGIPVVTLGPLFLLKLRAFRRQDQLDLVELIRRGCDVRAARGFVVAREPALVSRLDALIAEVDAR